MDRAREDALREAFERHYASLVRLGFLLTGHNEMAEDLVQDALVRSAEALGTLPADQAYPYLRRVVLNLWRNRLRRLALERRHRLGSEPAKVLGYEERTALWQAVGRLAPRQRACVVLRYYEDLSEAETAQALRCSVGTVKSQTHRGLAHVRKELGDGP